MDEHRIGSNEEVREISEWNEERHGAGDIPWQLAATPEERLAAGGGHLGDGDLAARRYAYWRELGWVKDYPERALARFRTLGLDESRFIAMFGEDPDALAKRLGPAPEWFHAALEASAETPSPGGEDDGEPDLLSAVAPLITRAQRKLAAKLEPIVAGAPDELASLVRLVDAPPAARIWEALHKTIVLELKVGQLNGTLVAETAEARLAEYVRSLEDPAARAELWAEYPVLIRYVVTALEQWVVRSAEVARRLVSDWYELRMSGLLPLAPGRLLELSVEHGDVHRDGQSVAIATFEHAKLVYKPRSLGAERVVHRLLDWFNAQNPEHDLRALRVLDRGHYGWTEFLAHEPCTDEALLPAFYWRAGAMLSLLHALWGIDFHRENLIACGAYPVAIDCEALCHILTPQAGGAPQPRDPDPVNSFLEESVVRVGLLPDPLLYQDEHSKWRRTDISALAGAAGQGDPVTSPTLVVEDGDFRIRAKRGEIEEAQNLPSALSPTAFLPRIVSGFEAAYRALMAGRGELLAPGGVLDWLRGVEMRLLLRPTMYYERVLQDSLHPDFLRDAMDRSICLDRLFSHGHVPGMARIIEDEIRQTASGNFPLFTFCPDTRDVILARGDKVLDFLPERPIDGVARRIRELSEDDMQRQCDAIELTLACFDPPSVPRPEPAPSPKSRPARAAELYAAANHIGAALLSKRIDRERRVGWLASKNLDEGVWTSGSVGADLYDGLAGIGLFLAVLGRQASNIAALRTAERIGDQIAAGLKPLTADPAAFAAIDPHHSEMPVGAFTGLGGALYYLGNLVRLFGDDRWLPAIEGLVAWMGRRCAQDPHLDAIGGSAGALLTLLSVRDLVDVRASARAAVDRLLETQVKASPAGAPQRISEDHIGGWPIRGASRPLAGMGHGASGMALALARWNAVTHDPRIPAAVASALAFEQRLFDADEGNWADVRTGERNFMAGWCHGAPGIGLARLGIRDAMGTPGAERELGTSIGATIVHGGFGAESYHGVGNDGLCHGDLGNLELLRLVAGTPADPGFGEAELSYCYAAILDRASQMGFLPGDPLGIANPGLMNGLAGIGLALLHAAAWVESNGAIRAPSVLLLQPYSA